MRLQLLWHRVEVVGDDEVLDVLGHLLADLTHPMAPSRSMRFEVSRSAAGIVVAEDGDHLVTVPGVEAAADAVYIRAYRRALELASLSGWVRVHAATLDVDGARVLVVGPSGSGKSTLALRAHLDGIDVHGDESVLVRPGASLAVPRPFHMKPGGAAALPELAAVLDDLPMAASVSILDPGRFGPRPPLRDAPVDHIVLLGVQGAGVQVDPVGTPELVEAMVRDAFVVSETKAGLLRTVVGSIGRARGHRLGLGPPEAMLVALRSLVR